MAGPDSNVASLGKSPYTQSTVEQDLRRLYRAEAFVELVRHYHESTRLCDALENPVVGPMRARGALPDGAFWPGEISNHCITEALHSAFMDISRVRASLNKALHPQG